MSAGDERPGGLMDDDETSDLHPPVTENIWASPAPVSSLAPPPPAPAPGVPGPPATGGHAFAGRDWVASTPRPLPPRMSDRPELPPRPTRVSPFLIAGVAALLAVSVLGALHAFTSKGDDSTASAARVRPTPVTGPVAPIVVTTVVPGGYPVESSFGEPITTAVGVSFRMPETPTQDQDSVSVSGQTIETYMWALDRSDGSLVVGYFDVHDGLFDIDKGLRGSATGMNCTAGAIDWTTFNGRSSITAPLSGCPGDLVGTIGYVANGRYPVVMIELHPNGVVPRWTFDDLQSTVSFTG